jgi:DNA-directed RNA polymerase specialized sigma24 family protein
MPALSWEAPITATPTTALQDARDDSMDAVRARLHAFLARRVESPEITGDLTQGVLARLLQRKQEAVENPTAWLYRIARNGLVDTTAAAAANSASTPVTRLQRQPRSPRTPSPTTLKPRNANLQAVSDHWSNGWPSPTARRSMRSISTVTSRLRSPARWGSVSPA